jgi:capsular polysaccharide biosynthesis protein
MSQEVALGGGVVRVGHVVDAIRRGWLSLLACLLLSIGLAGVLFTLTPASYTSRAALALPSSSPVSGEGSAAVSTATESAVVTSSSVAERAAKLLGSNAAGDLTDHVVVTSPLDSQILEIRFTATTPAKSAAGANAFAKAYLTYRSDLATAELQKRADRIQQRIAALDKASTEAQALRSAPGTSAAARAQAAAQATSSAQLARVLRGQLVDLETVIVSSGDIVDQAMPPPTRNFPRLPVFLVAGALVGMVIGLATALVRGSHNPRITGEADLAQLAGDRVLVTVPVALGRHSAGRLPAALSQDGGVEADAYRGLASKLRLSSTTHSSYLLLPAGEPYRGDAPLSLAVTMAAQGLRVILLGSDAASEEAAARLGFGDESRPWPPRKGRGADVDGVREVARLGQLQIVSFGDEAVVDATLSHQQDRFTALTQRVDMLVVDAVNVTMASTRLSLTRLAEDAIVVVSRGRSTVQDVQHALSELAQVATPARGLILLQPRRAKRRRNDQMPDLSRLHTRYPVQSTGPTNGHHPMMRSGDSLEPGGKARVGNGSGA